MYHNSSQVTTVKFGDVSGSFGSKVMFVMTEKTARHAFVDGDFTETATRENDSERIGTDGVDRQDEVAGID